MKTLLIFTFLFASFCGFGQTLKADSLTESAPIFASIKEVKKFDWVAFNRAMALISSATNGNWGFPFTWIGNNVPASNDDAEIRHTVTVNSTVNIHDINLKAGGVINFLNGGVLKVGN